MLRVGACQTPEYLGDVDGALVSIEDFAGRAEVDLLLFPECFLQGYLTTAAHVATYALDLDSLTAIRRRLRAIDPTLVVGFIERRAGRYYNSAVVLSRGEIVGVYRKTHLLASEAAVFDPGDSYPVFTRHGVTFGVNICYDTQFPAAAAAVAAKGAGLLLVPAQNMMRRESAVAWKDEHNRIRAHRVRETGMWLVSADVTGTRIAGGLNRVGLGPTSVMNPRAEVVAQVPLLATGFVVAQIEPGGDHHSPGSPPERRDSTAETAYHVVCPPGAAPVRRPA
jgi:predicted amidohydrolase